MNYTTLLLTATSGTNNKGNMWLAILLYAVIIIGGYFLLFRPSSKEKKRKRAMLTEMAIGDTVLTTSGFYGVLIDIQDEDVIVEFGNNKNCRIPMKKDAISAIEKASEGYEV